MPTKPLKSVWEELRFAGHSVVLVVAQHDLPKTPTDFGHAIMPPALKLGLDDFELRNHSFFRGDPTYGEGSAFRGSVGK